MRLQRDIRVGRPYREAACSWAACAVFVCVLGVAAPVQVGAVAAFEKVQAADVGLADCEGLSVAILDLNDLAGAYSVEPCSLQDVVVNPGMVHTPYFACPIQEPAISAWCKIPGFFQDGKEESACIAWVRQVRGGALAA